MLTGFVFGYGGYPIKTHSLHDVLGGLRRDDWLVSIDDVEDDGGLRTMKPTSSPIHCPPTSRSLLTFSYFRRRSKLEVK